MAQFIDENGVVQDDGLPREEFATPVLPPPPVETPPDLGEFEPLDVSSPAPIADPTAQDTIAPQVDVVSGTPVDQPAVVDAISGGPAPEANRPPAVEQTPDERIEAAEAQRREVIAQKAQGFSGFFNTILGPLLGPEAAGQISSSFGEAFGARLDGVSKRLSAADREFEAATAERRVRGEAFEGQAQIEADHRERLTNAADKFNAAIDDKMKALAESHAQILSYQENPDRAWKNKSGFKKAAVVLASGLFRALQARQGTVGGANPIIANIQREIDRDVAAQRAELEAKIKGASGARRDVATLQAQKASVEHDLAGHKASLLAGLLAETQAKLNEAANPRDKAALDKTRAAISTDYAKALDEYARLGADLGLKGFAAMNARLKAARGRGGGGAKPKPESVISGDPFGLTPGLRKQFKSAGVATTESTEWVNGSVARIRLSEQLSEYATIIKRVNLLGANTRLGNKDAAKIKQLQKSILSIGRRLDKAGANFTPEEMANIKDQFGIIDQGILKGAKVDTALFEQVVRSLQLDQEADNRRFFSGADLDRYNQAAQQRIRFRRVEDDPDKKGGIATADTGASAGGSNKLTVSSARATKAASDIAKLEKKKGRTPEKETERQAKLGFAQAKLQKEALSTIRGTEQFVKSRIKDQDLGNLSKHVRESQRVNRLVQKSNLPDDVKERVSAAQQAAADVLLQRKSELQNELRTLRKNQEDSRRQFAIERQLKKL